MTTKIGLTAAGVTVLAAVLGLTWIALLAGALLGLLLAALALKWAFWPRADLPRNRVRHQRIRLFLRLHPGRGHATVFELHRHWGRRASFKRIQRVRSS